MVRNHRLIHRCPIHPLGRFGQGLEIAEDPLCGEEPEQLHCGLAGWADQPVRAQEGGDSVPVRWPLPEPVVQQQRHEQLHPGHWRRPDDVNVQGWQDALLLEALVLEGEGDDGGQLDWDCLRHSHPQTPIQGHHLRRCYYPR